MVSLLCINTFSVDQKQQVKWKSNSNLYESTGRKLEDRVLRNNYSDTFLFLTEETNYWDASIRRWGLTHRTTGTKKPGGLEENAKRVWQTPARLWTFAETAGKPGGRRDRGGWVWSTSTRPGFWGTKPLHPGHTSMKQLPLQKERSRDMPGSILNLFIFRYHWEWPGRVDINEGKRLLWFCLWACERWPICNEMYMQCEIFLMSSEPSIHFSTYYPSAPKSCSSVYANPHGLWLHHSPVTPASGAAPVSHSSFIEVPCHTRPPQMNSPWTDSSQHTIWYYKEWRFLTLLKSTFNFLKHNLPPILGQEGAQMLSYLPILQRIKQKSRERRQAWLWIGSCIWKGSLLSCKEAVGR